MSKRSKNTTVTTTKIDDEAKKESCLVSGNWPGENFFIIYPPTQFYVYQNIYFLFETKKAHTQK